MLNFGATISEDVIDFTSNLISLAAPDLISPTFSISSASNLSVTDFVSGADKILLENSVFAGFAGLSTGQALPSSSFASGASPVATTTSATVLYNTSTGALLYDADGSGSGVAVQFATLGTTTHPTILASDFIIL